MSIPLKSFLYDDEAQKVIAFTLPLRTACKSQTLFCQNHPPPVYDDHNFL